MSYAREISLKPLFSKVVHMFAYLSVTMIRKGTRLPRKTSKQSPYSRQTMNLSMARPSHAQSRDSGNHIH